MAIYECRLSGDFDELLQLIDHAVITGGASASLENQSDFRKGAIRCTVRVYERYSWFGSCRVSLSVTLLDCHGDLFVSAGNLL